MQLSGGHRRRTNRGRWLLVAALGILGAAAVLIGLSRGGADPRSTPADPRSTPASSAASRATPAGSRRHRRSPRATAARHPPPGGEVAAARSAALAAPEVDHLLRTSRFVTAGARRRRVVALTFDDGPSPYTPAIVRTLARLHVPATFFVVGQQLRYFRTALHDELRHGFLIGDHTVNHPSLPHLGRLAQLNQIGGDARMLRAAGSPPVRLFRPPYGLANATTFAVLRRLRMLMVLWSVDPGDWRRPGAGAIVASVLRAVRPGAIVILHDGGGDRSQTLAALPAIVRRLRRDHYALVSVPELLRVDPPPRHQRLPALIGA